MAQEQPGSAPASLAHGSRQAGETIERSAERLEDAAVEHVHVFRSQLQSNVEKERRQAAEQLRRFGDALQSACEQIGPEDRTARAALDYASNRAERTAYYLSEASFADMRRDASDFARRRPGLVFGGALLLGITAARLLKAEAPLMARSSGNEPRPGSGTDESRVARGQYDYR